MRRFLILYVLLALVFVSVGAGAQNYVPADQYNNPNVVVNLDVLGAPAAPPVVPPSYTTQAPVVDQPVVLTPPAPRQVQEPQEATPTPSTLPAPRQLLARARAAAGPATADASNDRAPVLFDSRSSSAAVAQKEDSRSSPPSSSAAVEPVKAVGQEAQSSSSEAIGQDKDSFEAYRLLFADKVDDLSDEEKAVLRGVIKKIKADDKIRVQLLAFAAATPDTVSQARRLSLTRALSVRTMMISGGIAAERMDVRALGANELSSNKNLPSDRVDIIFVRE